MVRFLVLAGLVVLAVWLVRRALRAPDAAGAAAKGAPQAGRGAAAAEAGELVRCERCGLHLPRAEATARDGRVFCGEEHARLGPAQ